MGKPPFWTNAGEGAFYLTAGGLVLALVAWSPPPDVGELDRPGGEPAVTDGGWSLIKVANPGDHYALGVEDRQAESEALKAAEDLLGPEIEGPPTVEEPRALLDWEEDALRGGADPSDKAGAQIDKDLL